MGKPKVPNAMDTASASNASNLFTANAQAYLNNGQSQVTPWGSTSSVQNGFNTIKGPNGEEYQIPKFETTTTLSPNQKNLFDTQTGVGQQLANTAARQAIGLERTLGQQIKQPGYQSFQGGPKLQTSIAGAGPIQNQLADQDSWGRVQDVESAMFQRYNPQLEQDRQRMEQRLADQGIRAGSTAWNQAIDAQSRNVNDARLGITINSGQEQNRLQQLALNSGQFANAAQQQQYSQNANNAAFGNAAMQQGWQNNFNVTQANNGLQDSRFSNQIATRNQLVNEQSALMNGQQVQLPQFAANPQTSVAGTDVGSLVQNQYQNAYGQYGDIWGGIGSAAKGIFALSDRRAKDNIEKLGDMAKGVGVYSYTYKGDNTPQVGVMAQEVEKVVPSAVRKRPDGLREVNYPKLTMALGVR